MKRDGKLSRVLHVLLHMAEANAPLTSEKLATILDTNAVVIRRLLGGLREMGLVASDKGHGGGWVLSCDLKKLSLGDVHRALGSPALFTFGHRGEHPSCLVEKAVNSALDDAREAAETLLLKRLDQVSIATLSKEFHDAKKSRHASAHVCLRSNTRVQV